MLVLSRKKNESIVINNDITVTVVEIRGDKVRLGIVAPKEVPVHRQEAVPPLATTRDVLERALLRLAAAPTTSHVEIETYTWDALPAEHRVEGLVESLVQFREERLGRAQSCPHVAG